ncbi:uncharacterized protein MONBRDRAFT_26218 [Monosiga brevicollis MX1]|uniref:Uncharacterized protein n=1 Tax=Monosiga brevicollis TaxID=81824 RepID=A9V1P8_MONBE|nr:uncharacterized protein MONBRDRAFT_26218 [Monosiga brevicollis MX1]EDQ88481.1 predicted protein [Monosiga brevicollis MX1]|eukprot:XP_001746585.1 hypothetical protein [Monosiga brevicollis MX1]
MTTTGGFASSFVDLLGQLARCAEARGVYQPGLDEAFVPRWKGRFAALVHQMNADHIQRHFGGVCLRSSFAFSSGVQTPNLILLEDASRAADFEDHVQRAGFQMATVKDAATQRPAEIIALRSKAALDDLMAKCALDLQQAYLASREWGVSTVLTMRGRDKLRRLSDTTFAIAVVSMMGFGLHELINIKPTDKCPLCSSKTPQPRLTREHLLTCRPIKRHNALRDEMGRLLRYATLSHVWVEKSGYNANGQSCRIDLHCRNPFPGGALGPALPDLGIDVTVRTAQPPTTSQACIKVGAALRRAEKEKREYYTGFNHGKTLIVPAAMTTTEPKAKLGLDAGEELIGTIAIEVLLGADVDEVLGVLY